MKQNRHISKVAVIGSGIMGSRIACHFTNIGVEVLLLDIVPFDLTKEQKNILYEEGTEAPRSSPLNYEKREGDYFCAVCRTKLFESNKKYESGSGWPSFFESMPDVFETRTDNLIGSPRTEYHCKKCGGHHGHIFDDGPKQTGKRYCNNGLCLIFVPKKS